MANKHVLRNCNHQKNVNQIFITVSVHETIIALIIVSCNYLCLIIEGINTEGKAKKNNFILVVGTKN